MHAYVAMFERDVDRFRDALRRTDVMPLGSAAMAGTTYPIDRESVAADLGFAAITSNSMDGVSDRDYVIDALAACATLMMHISRLSEEIIFWSSGEAKYLTEGDIHWGSEGPPTLTPRRTRTDMLLLGIGIVFGR